MRLRYFFGGRLFPCALLTLFVALGTAALALWLPRALAPLAVAERLFSLAVALWEVNSKDLSECKLPKLVLIVFLPWTGALLCILWRRKPRPALLSVSASCKAESAEYFSSGREMYERFLCDLSEAKSFIWLEYYIIAHGAFFHAVLKILERKAAEGVDVRILYDDFGCAFTLPRKFPKDMKRRGIIASPVRKIGFPTRALNRRNHRKIAAIDGEIAYTGGLNLADEYIGEKLRFGHWKDTAVRITGEPARVFAKLFSSDAKGLRYEPNAPECGGNIPCRVVADCADDTERRAGETALRTLIASARERVFLNTPYLAPDEALLSALKTAAEAGKDVRVMIPHIPDKKAAFLISQSYAHELIAAGVQIREYTAGFLHAKSLVADGEVSFVSSYNLDFRSLYLQAECGIILEDAPLAQSLEQDFLSAWQTGTAVKPFGFFKRKLCAVLRLFAPLV